MPARTLADTAKALTAGDEVTIALAGRRRRRGPDRLRGRRPAHDHPAAGRRVPEVPLAAARPSRRRRRRSRPPRFVEAVKRVALVAERNTPVRLSFSAGEADPRGRRPATRRRPRRRSTPASQGDDISIAFNPAFLLDGLGRAATPRTPSCRSPTPTKPAVLTGKADARRDRRRRLPLPAHAGAAVRLRPARQSRSADGHGATVATRRRQRWRSVSSGSARWAATCASGCAAAGTPSSATTATRTISDVDGARAELVQQLPTPAGGLGDGAGRRRRPGRPIDALGELLDAGDVVVDGGNSRWTDDQEHAAMLGEQGHRLRRRRRLRRRLGPGERLRADGRRRRRARREGAAGLRRAQARGRLRLRARRPGRRRPLREDGPQRHRVRHDAGLRRGLRAARGRRLVTDVPGSSSPGRRARSSGPGCSTCWSAPSTRTRTWPRSAATSRTPARAAGPSRRPSTTPCRCR